MSTLNGPLVKIILTVAHMPLQSETMRPCQEGVKAGQKRKPLLWV